MIPRKYYEFPPKNTRSPTNATEPDRRHLDDYSPTTNVYHDVH
jgi:hypothetical protein